MATVDSYLNRLAPLSLAIFLFHGVIPKRRPGLRNALRKHVEEAYFSRLIRALSRHGQPVSMDEVLHSYTEGRPLPPRAFAITFDDGFANNLTVAAPILKRAGVPATFYITSGFVDDNLMSWTDRIDFCLEKTRARSLRPSFLRRTLPLRTLNQRKAAAIALRKMLKASPHLSPTTATTEVAELLRIPAPTSSRDLIDRKLTWHQVARLHKMGFTIGGHSHTHAILSHLSPHALQRDVDTCRAAIRRHLNIEPVHFSYPEGLAHCYSPAVIAALRRAGFRCCPTALPGKNTPHTGLFELRRYAVV